MDETEQDHFALMEIKFEFFVVDNVNSHEIWGKRFYNQHIDLLWSTDQIPLPVLASDERR